MSRVLMIGLPFDHGVLVSSTARVIKTPWGLVVGEGAVRGVERAVARLTPYTLDPAQRWLYSFEADSPWSAHGVDPVPGSAGPEERAWVARPVGLYQERGDGPAPATWGVVVLSDDQEGALTQVLRDGELRLQWDLDRGPTLEKRLEALARAFSWYRARWDWVPLDVEVGIHEPDHRYSVDRVHLEEPEPVQAD